MLVSDLLTVSLLDKSLSKVLSDMDEEGTSTKKAFTASKLVISKSMSPENSVCQHKKSRGQVVRSRAEMEETCLEKELPADFRQHLEKHGLANHAREIQRVAKDLNGLSRLSDTQVATVSQALPSESKRQSWLQAVRTTAPRLQINYKEPLSSEPTAASHIASILEKLSSKDGTLNLPDYMDNVRLVDTHFRMVAVGTVIAWMVLVGFVFWLTPPSKMQRLEGIEQNSAALACGILLVSCIGELLPNLYKQERRRFALSGIIVACITVQTIAFVTDGFMALGFATPVMYDPILGTRVHLLRWCEWTPLSFTIAFLTQGIDLVDPGANLKRAYMFAATIGLSTSMGLLFPFCDGPVVWGMCMCVSVALYFNIFISLYHKYKVFHSTKRGSSVDEIEHYDRVRLAYRLLATCAVTWTLLVALYFFSGIAPNYAPEGSFLKNKGFGMVWESLMDVLSKNLYLNIVVDVHKLVFDDGGRAERRLAELRRLMSAVWESSSDVICISVRGMSGTVTTMVSPAYSRVYGGHSGKLSHAKALVFDLEPEEFESDGSAKNVKPRVVQHFDFNAISELRNMAVSGGTFDEGKQYDIVPTNDPYFDAADELSSVADLIVNAWRCDRSEALLTHKLLKRVGNEQRLVPGEASVSRLEENALVVVVRDISERFQRFEAEKQLITEATARKKDEEANRFTRHEVKNGLLAAIGLCDSLKDGSDSGKESSDGELSSKTATNNVAALPPSYSNGLKSRINASKCTKELDKTLKDVLDTVLSEAMARDVIHGVYEPRLERVKVKELLCSLHVSEVKHDRFPITSAPSPLPMLISDPQLLKYIHRNAVSNACKYGKKGGVVTTEIKYDSEEEILEINVINMPGEYHNELLRLGDRARDEVFLKGTRLHQQLKESTRNSGDSAMHSSGDGAWIMRKCAETLRGEVDIMFEENRTVFSFRSPAKRYNESLLANSQKAENFQLPPHTWGIAIDDSKIQRKLLDRFFMFLGVEDSRRVILGSDAEEIMGFDDFVVQLIDHNPLDKFVLIADENLDIFEDATRGATVSGSMCVENIRRRLLPNQERRLLALVRSANDSAQDVALYNSRAHGYIPKAPIKGDAVREILAPLWEQRFMYAHSSTAPVLNVDGGNRGYGSDSEDSTDVRAEVRHYLDAIDSLCAAEDALLLPQRWPMIWEKLVALKGDLLTSFHSPAVTVAVKDINSLNVQKLPHDFVPRWKSLRTLVTAIMSDCRSCGKGARVKRPSLVASIEEPSQKKIRAVSDLDAKLPAQSKRDFFDASDDCEKEAKRPCR